MAHTLTRRRLLAAAAGTAGVVAVGGLAARQLAARKAVTDGPDVPAGDIRLIRIGSRCWAAPSPRPGRADPAAVTEDGRALRRAAGPGSAQYE
ncbi:MULTISPECIES: hypothetical protein [Micromonospora]|uniref:Tat (Twin-arginine translocation) pathway signal sequence n=1 Tax=Micromonospora solifontis TaxID=2487138 RepID=A0ABX9WLC6_9ACTN|nr:MULTISPECIES: hypothetical protein [Micromonospora]NES15608.1 hypothetical protein [Micromonospora sp. PPF5-17B]NES35887.1 hypothetical protein [Micromonospora solifontis]NES56857.1 hypothetical protein [Micromonospora sp. PPF5-6]RNM00179.1 hypothetical protein EFE23_06870 [Micromonospora solifontis]